MARSLAINAGYSERVHFEKQNVQSTPYPDDSFDAVISIYMLHIIEEPKKMLGEIERVLKPKGIFYLCDIRRSWLGYLTTRSPIIKNSISKRRSERNTQRINITKMQD